MQNSRYITDAKNLLEGARGKKLSTEERREKAISLAALMLNESRRVMTYKEQRVQSELSLMMEDEKGKAFTTAMTDESFRSLNSAKVADQISHLIDKFGVPHYLSYSKQISLRLFKWLGQSIPFALVPMLKKVLRWETSRVILPGEPKALSRHIRQRIEEGVRVNLNHLGEAILGEKEAEKKLKIYLEDLARPEVEYISIKISTLCSQLNLLDWDQTLSVLATRLKSLYRQANSHTFVLPGGKQVPKFVNLDMEEYRDLHLTCHLFRHVLDDPEFFNTSAGIVLQAYLPDSYLMQRELTNWAISRFSAGGAPIKIRIVKGANLAMEKIEAATRLWPQSPFQTKSECDANFKRMVHWGLDAEHAKACRIGIASHNLFDIAYALLMRCENGVEPFVCFEMLEGMADQMRRVVQGLADDMLLYCPAATKEEFVNAVAYLVRRLDENTAPENFLRHLFGLLPGTREWQTQSNLFSIACHSKDQISYAPRRTQNRLLEPVEKNPDLPFSNEPDTDWSLPQNRKFAKLIIERGSKKDYYGEIPLVICGKEMEGAEKLSGKDPSRPHLTLYHCHLADSASVDLALNCSEKSGKAWGSLNVSERSKILSRAAQKFREQRSEMLEAMVADGGKTLVEADVEYSEAIDFIEYYRKEAEAIAAFSDVKGSAKGTVVVVSPWNFPCSIPTGGIAAALSSGNAVIFKPAQEASLVGYKLAKLFWEAGVSKEVLQFVPCRGSTVGSQLIADPRVSLVVLTGSTETAKMMHKTKPGLELMAETGGKNSIIVSSLSDRDLAVRDLIQSAFSHSGQKCSACSLGILVAEVYDDLTFLEHLKDAAASMKVGPAWDLGTKVNPLIHAPESALLRGLTTLEEGESWLLEPKCDPENPNLWSPGIKLGVKEGSFTHQTELFGPVLGLMRANDFNHALSLANGTCFGLTAGLQSLDDREMELWKKTIVAGNLYINRGITGAIVQRQPFGGCKESSFGTGAKAGGPNYLSQMLTFKQIDLPKEQASPSSQIQLLSIFIPADSKPLWEASIGSYTYWWNHYFSKGKDPSLVLGQDNILSYVPHRQITFRFQQGDQILDLYRIAAAAVICSTPLEISGSEEILGSIAKSDWIKLVSSVKIIPESDEELIERLNQGKIKRIRLISRPSLELKKALSKMAVNLHQAPVLANGRFELFHFLREVALSFDYHRYGNLGLREHEERAPIE